MKKDSRTSHFVALPAGASKRIKWSPGVERGSNASYVQTITGTDSIVAKRPLGITSR